MRIWRVSQVMVCVAAALLLNLESVRGVVISTFDTGAEGWTVLGDASSGTPTYVATGGNPGGHISADDTVADGVWLWNAPAKFLGNQSNAVGESLSFDLRQSASSSQFDSSDVIIISPTVTLRFDTALNPATTWTSYTLPITETAGWVAGPTLASPPATLADITMAFSNITSLQIRGEFRTGGDTGWLDNVILVPEPASGALLLLAAACPVLCFRHRRRNPAGER